MVSGADEVVDDEVDVVVADLEPAAAAAPTMVAGADVVPEIALGATIFKACAAVCDGDNNGAPAIVLVPGTCAVTVDTAGADAMGRGKGGAEGGNGVGAGAEETDVMGGETRGIPS